MFVVRDTDDRIITKGIGLLDHTYTEESNSWILKHVVQFQYLQKKNAVF